MGGNMGGEGNLEVFRGFNGLRNLLEKKFKFFGFYFIVKIFTVNFRFVLVGHFGKRCLGLFGGVDQDLIGVVF